MFNNAPMFKANGTISPAVFVKIDTTGDGLAIQAAAATDLTVGVSQVGMKRAPGLPGSDNTIAAQAGDMIQVYSIGDVCLLTFGGTVTRGDLLTSNASGQGITTTTTGNWCGARALQSGTTGSQGLVQIVGCFHT